jgi:hypothetical protein
VPDRLLIVALLLATAAAASGVELTLSPRALAEAIDVGQSRIDSYRSRFHTPYRIPIARPPVDYVDVVTPFRRVALAAETRARLGDRFFGQREAKAILADAPDQVDLLFELTFNPLNTYVGMPAYDVRLLAAAAGTPPTLSGSPVGRFPRFGPRTEPPGVTLPYPYSLASTIPLGSEPLTGGTLLVHLDVGEAARNGAYDVLVIEGGKELARARIDFRALR